jgi:hypothetical protein
LYFKGQEIGLGVASGTVMGTWGNSFSRTTPVKEQLPDRLAITFYSYAENQSYRGEFDLPYEKLLVLFQWGAKNKIKVGDEKRQVFNDLVVGVAPGGTVALWAYGNQEQREIFIGQAKKIDLVLDYVFQVPFRSDVEAEQFRVRVLEKNIGADRVKAFEVNGIPFDIWQRYRQPYHWLMELSVAAKFTDVSLGFINGEHFKLNEQNGLDYKKVNYLHLPSNVFFRVNGKPYVLRFDDYETIAAFETLAAIEGLTEEEQVIHIEITPRLPRETSTVRLYNAEHSIELKKTAFKP